MTARRDPVQEATDASVDLYDIATWEERTSLDGLAVALYRLLVGGTRLAVVLLALLILGTLGGLSALTNPQVGALTGLSAIPALGLAAYVWYSDVTTPEPLSLLVVTFLLGMLTANFAAVVNSVLGDQFRAAGPIGMVVFFYLVVGPVEETVKLLAVRLWAFESASFDAVVDGAVYGAMAGLGFATIENALYITRNLGGAAGNSLVGLIGAGAGITAIRALAGPGHVIYSAFAGYYLGLAKFNSDDAGPIAVKGLLIAAFIHGTYNTLVTYLPFGIGTVASELQFFGFILVFDGVIVYALYRKLRRYRSHYRRATGDQRDGET
ncbi:MAG: PrsW family intramembrane metalloprotease, partial [Salinigranum sp.]